ncbi:AMP-binding protein [Nocardia ignorata]|uniref:AMP-binding enzyme n=2 Tax=Nocardia ignorata TaxID=145285 RepID=A0A4R6P193_NOCIG|nr:AMP-binding protein [Nocardia ignorata]TDP27613.1 AMP-binding enzyme [Nocardia ignorata]
MPRLMSAAVEQNPDGVALVFADGTGTLGSLSYRELDQRSTRIARYLIDLGVGPESLVAMGITRSIESVLAVWAIAKTGAGFVPIDPRYPADRITHMVSDSGVALGITVTREHGKLPGGVEWLDLGALEDAAEVRGYSVEPSSMRTESYHCGQNISPTSSTPPGRQVCPKAWW